MINTDNSKIGNPFPFRVFCQKVIPLAFDESMSYLELLYSLLHYLKETVIPAVNNNADAVTELQNLYNELKSYVDNYFDNLDVQEEINNKLDEMAESGQLADIISQFLELASVLAFDTVENMKNGDNFVNGSIVRTLGKEQYNDGYGSFYKIRTILNTDTIDNENIIALTNFPNLVAEKIFNKILVDNNIIINDEMQIISSYRGLNNGDCSIIRENGKNILIDLGTDIQNTMSYLLANGITKIDYIIISHYHVDHIGGDVNGGSIATFLDNNLFDFSDVVFYLPHKNIDWNRINAGDKNYLITAQSTIKNELESRNITYIEPNENDELILNINSKIRFLNLSSEWFENYYGEYGNEYNNFSMCCELKHNNTFILFTGDIYIQALTNISKNINRFSILKCPHHNLEPLSSDDFLKKICNNTIMYFQEHQDYTGNYLLTPIAQTIQNNGGSIYDLNNSRTTIFKIINNKINIISENGLYTLNNIYYFLGAGLKLENGTNLNNLRDIGSYFTENNSQTMSLLNLPLAVENQTIDNYFQFGRCRVIVESLNYSNNYIRQTFISPIYKFTRTYNENSWTNWKNDNELGLTDNFIQNGTDLNNISNPGKYEINNDVVYNSLINAPTTGEGGSILLVYNTRIRSDIRHQIIMTASGNIFHRCVNYDEYDRFVSAKPWFKINMTQI